MEYCAQLWSTQKKYCRTQIGSEKAINNHQGIEATLKERLSLEKKCSKRGCIRWCVV